MQKTMENTSLTGGITDEYIESDLRFVNHAENLCLDHSSDIVQRQGSHFLEGSDPKDGSFVSSGTTVTHTSEFTFNNPAANYLASIHNSGQSLSVKKYLAGVLTNQDLSFPFTTTHSVFNSSVWQAQPFFASSTIATGQGNYPVKITADKTAALNDISAGMPEPIVNAYDVYLAPDNTKVSVQFRVIASGAPITTPYKAAVVTAIVSPTPTGVSNEFRLACVYRRKYKVNGVTYEDVSRPHFIGYISNASNLPVGKTPGTTYALECRIQDTLQRQTSSTIWQTNWNDTSFTYRYNGVSGDANGQPYVYGIAYDTSETFDVNGMVKVSFYKTTANGNIYYNFGPGNVPGSNPNGGFPLPGSFGDLGIDYKYDLNFGEDLTHPDIGLSRSETTWTDTEIQSQPVLYTTSGVQANDLPGRVRYNTLVNDNYMYWVDAENPYRVRQASSRDPDSVPTGNFIDFPEIVTGISSAANKLIVCTLTKTYRVDGFYDDFGRGTVIAELISNETGTISHNSMVRVSDGLFFCGVDGFYYTNGQTVQKISKHLSATYFRITQTLSNVSNATSGSITTNYGKKYTVTENQDIVGTYDKLNNRVMWSFLGGTEVFVCEKSYGLSEKMSFFGPWKLPTSSATDSGMRESVYAKTIGTFANKMVRTDANGNIFQLEDGVASDPRPFTFSATVPTNWLAADRYPILYRLRTQTNFLGSQMTTKYVTRMSAIFKRISAFFPVGNFFDRRLDVLITSINDKGRVVQDLKPVHYLDSKDNLEATSKMEGTLPYNATLQVYADPTPNQYSSGSKDNALIKATRRFVAKGLRCTSKALEFKPALSLIAKSDDFGLINFTAGACSIIGGAIWSKYTYTGNVITIKEFIGVIPEVDHSVEGYYISVEYDNYTALYPITNVSGDGVTAILGTPFLNYTGVAAPTGTYKWKLYAMPKNQFFGLCAYSISYSDSLDAGTFYRIAGNSGDKGEP